MTRQQKRRQQAAPRFRTLRAFVDSYPRSVTQAEIAAVLGVTPAALSGYMIGRLPGRETALRLSRDFGIDLEGLLDPGSQEAVAS